MSMNNNNPSYEDTERQDGWMYVVDKKKSSRKGTSISAPSTPTHPNQLCTLKESSAPVTPLSREYIAALPSPPTSPTCPVVVNPTKPTFAPIHLGATKYWKSVENTSFDINDENDFPKITSTSPISTSPLSLKRLNLSTIETVEKKKKKIFNEKVENTCYSLQNFDSLDSLNAKSPLSQFGMRRKRNMSNVPEKSSKRLYQDPVAEQSPVASNINYRNGTGSPSEEELEFLEKYSIMSEAEKFTRCNPVHLLLKPVMYRFRNNETFTEDLQAFHFHCAKTFDIIIRKTVYDVGGNMDTEFWFELYSPDHGYPLKQWEIKTPATFGGIEVMKKLARRMYAKKTLKLDHTLEIYMNVFRDQPSLSGKGQSDEEKDTLPKKGVRKTVIQEYPLKRYFGDALVVGSTHCLPKALAIGKLKADLKSPTIEDQTKWDLRHTLKLAINLRNMRAVEMNQLTLAKDLLKAANMDPLVEDHTLDDLKTLAEFLPEYQIKLWICEGKKLPPHLHLHLNEWGHSFIGLVYYNNHFDCVRTLKREASKLSFCYKCTQWDNSAHCRRCTAKCWFCGWLECSGRGDEKIKCDQCYIDFKSQDCYDRHLKPVSGRALPNCVKFFYCTNCNRYGSRARYGEETHVCEATFFCPTCNRNVSTHGHNCKHSLPTEDKKNKDEKKVEWVAIFYDMKCIVAESGEYRGSVARGPTHKPNMIVAKVICNECCGKDCAKCGETEFFSYEDGVLANAEKNDVLEGFIKFLLEDPRIHREDVQSVKVLAHNGGQYDHLLCIQGIEDYLGDRAPVPNISANGGMIVSAKLNHRGRTLHFLDSMQFLQMKIANKPTVFGLTGEEGYFPYLYNHPDNYGKVLQTLPPKEYYAPDRMTSAKREVFDKWHAENYLQEFTLHSEMKKFCLSVVRVLTQALVYFINEVSPRTSAGKRVEDSDDDDDSISEEEESEQPEDEKSAEKSAEDPSE